MSEERAKSRQRLLDTYKLLSAVMREPLALASQYSNQIRFGEAYVGTE